MGGLARMRTRTSGVIAGCASTLPISADLQQRLIVQVPKSICRALKLTQPSFGIAIGPPSPIARDIVAESSSY